MSYGRLLNYAIPYKSKTVSEEINMLGTKFCWPCRCMHLHNAKIRCMSQWSFTVLLINSYLVPHNKFHALTYAWFCLKGMVYVLENLNSIKSGWQFSGTLLPLMEHSGCQALFPEGRTHQKPVCSYKRQLHRGWAQHSLIAAVSIVQGPNLV